MIPDPPDLYQLCPAAVLVLVPSFVRVSDYAEGTSLEDRLVWDSSSAYIEGQESEYGFHFYSKESK